MGTKPELDSQRSLGAGPPTRAKEVAIKAREQADFDEFVRATWSGLYRTAYLLVGDHQLAEDLLQTTYAKLFSTWGRASKLEFPVAYARKALANQATSWWRRRSSSEVPSDLATFSSGTSDGHDDDVARARDVWAALATLPARQRAVMVLRYYEDLSEAEIADVLDISPGTVKSHAHLAAVALSRRLGVDEHDLLTNGGKA